MQIRIWYIITIFIVISLLHIFAVLFGLYSTSIVWIDKLQHILAGVAVAMFFLYLQSRKRVNLNSKRKLFFKVLFLVLIVAIIWELLEFSFLEIFPLYAKKFSLYSPTLEEAIGDIIANLIGALLSLIFIRNK